MMARSTVLCTMRKPNLTAYECWIGLCDEFNTLLYPLETVGGMKETGLFQTKKEYTANHCTYYESPVYHVWIKGERIASTMNYIEAYNIWRDRLQYINCPL